MHTVIQFDWQTIPCTFQEKRGAVQLSSCLHLCLMWVSLADSIDMMGQKRQQQWKLILSPFHQIHHQFVWFYKLLLTLEDQGPEPHNSGASEGPAHSRWHHDIMKRVKQIGNNFGLYCHLNGSVTINILLSEAVSHIVLTELCYWWSLQTNMSEHVNCVLWIHIVHRATHCFKRGKNASTGKLYTSMPIKQQVTRRITVITKTKHTKKPIVPSKMTAIRKMKLCTCFLRIALPFFSAKWKLYLSFSCHNIW